MEDSLDFNISQELVEVKTQVELALNALHLGGADDHISLTSFKLASSGVFSFSLDWGKVGNCLLVKSFKMFGTFVQFKDCDVGVNQSFGEWIFVVLALHWKSSSVLLEREHDLAIVLWFD